MPSIALYYPWMHFQNDEWLRLALLAWDSIVRIRPSAVEDRDGDLVRQIRAESDLLLEVTPSRSDLAAVEVAFSGIIDEALTAVRPNLLTWSDESHRLYAATRVLGLGAGRAAYRPPASQQPPMADPELLWVYCGREEPKMSDSLRRKFLQTGLAVQRESSEPWVGMRPLVGSVYTAALADVMARRNAMAPVTDDPRMHRAMGAVDNLASLLTGMAPPPPAIEDVQSAYVNLALSAALRPRGISAVPVSRLLDFRNRHKAELAAFREHIASLAAELEEIAKVENPEVARAHLQGLYDRTTKRHLDEVRGALRAFGIDSTVGALELKVDLGAASGTALGVGAAAGGHLALGAAAVAVTVVPYLTRAIGSRNRLRSESPVAYLLAADKELNHTPSRRIG